jgi:hypothetical protein
MPAWTVQIREDTDERVEAGMLATDAGALIAFSEEGLVQRAWAPGQWQTVRRLEEAEGLCGGEAGARDDVLSWLPRG